MKLHYYHREFLIKPCPWCNETPKCDLPSISIDTGETWIWRIQCENPECLIRPKSEYVAIRNTSKYHLGRQINKLLSLIYRWNKNNPRHLTHKTYVTFEIDIGMAIECSKKFKSQFEEGYAPDV